MKNIKKFRYVKSITSQFKNVWGIYKFFFLKHTRSYKKKVKKQSFFCELSNSKKIIKIFYLNLKEKRLKKMFLFSKCSPFYSIDKFVSLLEARIDTVLYRSCFVSSPKESKFYVSRKCILVNGRIVEGCNFILRKNDIIQFSKNFFFGDHNVYIVKNLFLQNIFLRPIPSHLEIDFQLLQVIFLWEPRLLDCYFPINVDMNHLLRFYY